MSIQKQVQIEVREHQAVIVLPPEILQKLNASVGDRLDVLETPGGLELRCARAANQEQLDLVEELLRDNQEVLRKLAQ